MLAPIQPHRPSDSPDSGHLCLALSAQVASLEDLFILLDLPRIPPPPGSCPSPPQGRLAPSSVLLIPACLTDLSHLLAVTGLGLPPHHPAPAWEERLSASVSLLTSLSPAPPHFRSSLWPSTPLLESPSPGGTRSCTPGSHLPLAPPSPDLTDRPSSSGPAPSNSAPTWPLQDFFEPLLALGLGTVQQEDLLLFGHDVVCVHLPSRRSGCRQDFPAQRQVPQLPQPP